MQFILFSVFQSNLDHETNVRNHLKIKNNLKELGVNYSDLDGYYNGKGEFSLMVDAKQEGLVEALCKVYNQESYLFVDRKRRAFLTFLEGDQVLKLEGKFKEVDRSTAILQENYTFNPRTEKYYSVL